MLLNLGHIKLIFYQLKFFKFDEKIKITYFIKLKN